MNTVKHEQEKLDCRWKTTPEQRREIIERRLNGESQASIARSIGDGLHQSSISRIFAQYLKSKIEEEQENGK